MVTNLSAKEPSVSEILTGIYPQADFPRVDLTDGNADMLELMMANVDIVNESHRLVEDTSWIFRVGHATVLHGTKRTYDDSNYLSSSRYRNRDVRSHYGNGQRYCCHKRHVDGK